MSEWLIQILAGGAFTAVLTVLGWVLNSAVSAVAGLKKELEALKLDLAKNYVTHNDLEALKKDQSRMLQMLSNLQAHLAAIGARIGVEQPKPEQFFRQE